MNIIFDWKSKEGMEELVAKSSESYLKIKCFRGCGKPAYEIFPSFKGEEDEVFEKDGLAFVYSKGDEKLIDGIEIFYDKDKYINGFYVKS